MGSAHRHFAAARFSGKVAPGRWLASGDPGRLVRQRNGSASLVRRGCVRTPSYGTRFRPLRRYAGPPIFPRAGSRSWNENPAENSGAFLALIPHCDIYTTLEMEAQS
jgi:hypothetical protein